MTTEVVPPRSTSRLTAVGFPEESIRERARDGVSSVFPGTDCYGDHIFGWTPPEAAVQDALDEMRLVPPVFMPARLSKLIDLGREPTPDDVSLESCVGGFRASAPLYVSAFGSTRAAGDHLGLSLAMQAARLGLPMVIGENVVPTAGFRDGGGGTSALLARINAYGGALRTEHGGVVIQQSTQDADAEVWNRVYSDPGAAELLATGRLGFELKVGQGAKPGLGGMTIVDSAAASKLGGRFAISAESLDGADRFLRSASAGTFTADILLSQLRLMRNNYPRAKTWVKVPPARDLTEVVAVAAEAGVDAVVVDGAEGGTGWAPTAFMQHVGLPLAECLRRLTPGRERRSVDLMASGRMWEGARVAKVLALGTSAVGLGRAALIAVDEDPRDGLVNLVAALQLELRMLASALGHYDIQAIGPADVWCPGWEREES